LGATGVTPALSALLAAPEGAPARLTRWVAAWRRARRLYRTERPIPFDALSLDASGKPIRVMNSDDVLILFDETLPEAEPAERLVKYERTYPEGLMTPVGVVVANGTHSGRPGDAKMFDSHQYHGAVIWAWPELVLEAGLLRQLRVRTRP